MWTDKDGRDWSTAVTVSTIKRVNDYTDILLTDAADTDLVDRLYSDVMLLADVLFSVCGTQANERSIDATAFGELLSGDVLDKACESLMADIVLFFQPRRRPVVEKLWATAQKLELEKMGLIDRKLSTTVLDRLIGETVANVSKAIDERLAAHGDKSGKSPDSSASTPAI